jgi:drug/metabolite transporter (DMT)-like permease
LSWKDWICVLAILLGVILTLYGANYYNDIIGWFGVFLFAGGIVALILFYVYGILARPKPQTQTQNAYSPLNFFVKYAR